MKRLSKLVLLAFAFTLPMLAGQAEASNQVFFRGGYSLLTDGRGREVFTDTLGTTTVNNGTGGYSIAAGLRLGMHEMDWFSKSSLMGEIFSNTLTFQETPSLKPQVLC